MIFALIPVQLWRGWTAREHQIAETDHTFAHRSCRDQFEKSQHRNREIAMQVLKPPLMNANALIKNVLPNVNSGRL